MTSQFKPRVYLKDGCPFSFKCLLFLTESRLLDGLDIVRVPAKGPEFDRTKEQLTKGLGKSATFPTAEIEPGKFMADSDRLIDHFAKSEGASKRPSVTMRFYAETILPQVVKLHEMEEGS